MSGPLPRTSKAISAPGRGITESAMSERYRPGLTRSLTTMSGRVNLGALPNRPPSIGPPMKLRSLGLAAAGLLVAGGTMAVTLSPASAATTGCSVVYKVTGSWQGGVHSGNTDHKHPDPAPAPAPSS